MDAPSPPEVFQFGDFRLDRRGGGLFRYGSDGALAPVSVGTRALDVLALLVERKGEVVSKDEALAAVWPNTVVEEANLAVQVRALRQVLDGAGATASCIQTEPGRGYRFVVPVTRIVGPGWEAEGAAIEGAPEEAGVTVEAVAVKRRFSTKTFACLAVVLLAILTAGFTGVLHNPTWAPAETSSPLDRRQSVIVLPFGNVSGDPKQDGLAARLTRDVTDYISPDTDMPMVPAAIAAQYEGKGVDLGVIGREQNVHFALTGNVREQGGRLTGTVVLYDIADARQVWSRRFDEPGNSEGRGTILQRIYENTLQVTVDAEVEHAMRDRPGNLDKRDFLLASTATMPGWSTKASIERRVGLIDQALALDPEYFPALVRQARLHATLVLAGFSTDPDADLAVAATAADRLLQFNPNSTRTLTARSFVLRAQGRWDEAAEALRAVLRTDQLEGNRHTELGMVQMAQGRHVDALASFQTAKRVAGGTDSVHVIDAFTAQALLATAQFSDAIRQAYAAIAAFPSDSGRSGETPFLTLIAAESENGQGEDAHRDLREFLATTRVLHSMLEVNKLPWLAANPKLIEGLRLAGMPES